MEEFEGMGEGKIRIFGAQHGRRDGREVLGNNYGGGLGEAGGGGVLGVGDEGEFSGAGLLDAVEAGDVDVGEAVVEARVEGGCDLREFHGR